MVYYIYSLRTSTDDMEEIIICINETQNNFCKKNLIDNKTKKIKLVIHKGFNESINWNFYHTLDIVDQCISHENIDLKNLINSVGYASNAVDSINIAMKN